MRPPFGPLTGSATTREQGRVNSGAPWITEVLPCYSAASTSAATSTSVARAETTATPQSFSF
jgi:hypothetical protein